MAEQEQFIVTPPFRMAYPNFFKPGRLSKRYDVNMLFPKGADVQNMHDAVAAAVEKKWGDRPPENLGLPWRDGDTESKKKGKAGFAGTFVAIPWSDYKPDVVGPNPKIPIDDQRMVVGGFWARATVSAFGWTFEQFKHGISFNLVNVQLLPIREVIRLYEGQNLAYDFVEEAFGGGGSGPSAGDMFSEVDNPAEDPSQYVRQGGDFMGDSPGKDPQDPGPNAPASGTPDFMS